MTDPNVGPVVLIVSFSLSCGTLNEAKLTITYVKAIKTIRFK